ncbi:MAG: two-component sensor histidine kinase [Flavobacteriales bacterium]|jgi:two-component sensor histidine kinase
MMIRTVYITLALIALPGFLSAQVIDSLIQAINLGQRDTVQMHNLESLTAEYNHINDEKGVETGYKAVELARQLGHTRGEAMAHYVLGIALDLTGQADSCVYHQLIALDIFREEGDQVWVGNTMNSIGVSYYYAGDMNAALKWYLDVMEHWENLGDANSASKTINNIGVIYRLQFKYKEAIEIYKKSEKIKLELGDEIGLAKVYHNIGLAHSYLGDENNCVLYIQKALYLNEKLGLESEVLSSKASLGVAKFKLGQYEESELLLLEAIEYREFFSETTEVPEFLTYLGRVKMELGKPQEALTYLIEAEEILRKTDRREILNELNLTLALCYYSMNRFRESSDYYRAHEMTASELTHALRIEEMEKMQESYNAKEREKELEISQLKLADKERQQLIFQWGTALGLLVLLILAYTVWIKIRSNNTLAKKNEIIENSLSEKEILLREIHHRVKNNLQVVSSLLSIQSRGIVDKKALEAVNESRNRVKSMALIHQDLYREENLTNINVQSYIVKLSESLFHSYNVDENQINFVTDVEDISLDVDTIIPLGLILNELMSNALKYAFIEQEGGRLEVKLKKVSDCLEMEVIDDGVGIDFNSLNESSFGLKMIRAFSDKLGASFEVKNENGTHTKLTVKKFKAA